MRLVSGMVVMLALACPESESGTTTQSDETGGGASSEGASDSGSTGRDDTGSGGGSGSTEVGGSSEAPLPGACVEDAECRLYSDCCTCDAFASDEEPPTCDADCERTLCEEWGITEAICSHTCHLRLVDCDPALIMCADAMPECEAGFVPSIEQRCWTRHCVPAELCTPY